ncbi:MAG TPA: hypothetical protein VND22_03275 [Actinomycetota bacterium]|nr:hypothetical protein [Actinomycetota bacterium]
MRPVVFVAPFFLETTLRFVDAAASLPGVGVGLISEDPEEKLPPGLRAKLAAHWRVDDGMDPFQIAGGVRALSAHLGGCEKLLGALEELQVPLAEVREGLGIEGMDVETARNFRDKARMKDVFGAAGVPCAPHRLVGDAQQALSFANEVGFPLVAKPPAGAGARSTFRLDDADSLGQWLAAQPPRHDAPFLLEEFVQGEEHSFDSVLIGGRMIWHSISQYLPTPLEVLRNPWIQWAVILPREIGDEFNDIRIAAVRGLEALGLVTGLTHMEWFRRKDGSIAISEVAARPPGAQFTTLMSYAHDLNFYRAWAELMIFDRFDPPERQFAVGAAFLRGQGTGRVTAIHGVDEVARSLAPIVVEAKLPQPGQAPSGTYEGEGYVVVRHEDTAVVEEAIRQLVTTIKVELG